MPQFTKKAIIESFMTLLETKALDKITVKDIVEDCGVNRGTFYYYYEDIYSLVDELFNIEAENVIKNDENFESWQKGFLESTKFARQNRKIIYHIYNSVSREKLEEYLYKVTDNLLGKYIEKESEGLQVSDEDKRFLLVFYRCALVGSALDWIRLGMRDDIDHDIEVLGIMFEGNIRQALKRVAKNSTD